MSRTPVNKAERVAARLIPAGSIEQRYSEVDAVVYLRHEQAFAFFAIAYAGSAMRPAFNYRFRTSVARAAYVEQWVNGLQTRQASLLQREQERRHSTHTFLVGDVLYSSWGYEQTNVEFYQVIRVVSDKSIEVHEIAQTRLETLFMLGTAMPVVDHFLPKSAPLVRRARGDGIQINSHIGASRWDGRPVSYSSYA